MPFPGQHWPLNFKVVACLFHTLAIISGIFRSTYRWYISRFGWDDTWALLAVVTDVGCLICSWLQQSIPSKPTHTDLVLNWPTVVTLSSVPWEARLSMIASIIRITNPRTSIRRMSYAIAISFGLMWIGLSVQKSYACGVRLCVFPHYTAILSLTFDTISDVLLVFMPLFILKGVNVSRSQRVLLVSSFASSICITILSIAQAICFFLPVNGASLLSTHIKAALSVVICNLLVVVTFAYKVYHKTNIDVGESLEHPQFTTVVPGQLSLGTCTCPTSSLPSPLTHPISSS